MINMLLLSVMNSLFIVGLTMITQEGFIGHPLRKLIEENYVGAKWQWLYDFIANPLIGCVICMASIWGTIGFFIGYSYGIAPLVYWPAHLIIVAGLNQYFWRWN